MSPYTLYDELGLNYDASPEDIRTAYRDLARRLHPDKNQKPGDTELFINVQNAYETLSNEERKTVYDSQLTDAQKSIRLDIYYSRSNLATINEPQLLYVFVDLYSRSETQLTDIPAINLCLILDASSSMKGEVFDTVKRSAIQLTRLLRPQDILSIVSFSDKAEVIIPAGKLSDRSKIEMLINMLQTQGGTEIFRGLETGFSEVRRFVSHNQINHIILITDGRTYGDEDNCMQIAHQCAKLGIAISTFGIGSKWNDAFLDHLAVTSGGLCQYISSPAEILKLIIDRFSSLSLSYADQVNFQYEIEKDISLLDAYRITPNAMPLDVSPNMLLGSLPRASHLQVIIELLIAKIPQEINSLNLLEGTISCNIHSSDNSMFQRHFILSRSVSHELSFYSPPQLILRAISRLTLYRMQERSKFDLAEGNIHRATRRLQNLATHLLAQGEIGLAKVVLDEVANIQKHNMLSEEGEKRIKFGTRAILLPESN